MRPCGDSSVLGRILLGLHPTDGIIQSYPRCRNVTESMTWELPVSTHPSTDCGASMVQITFFGHLHLFLVMIDMQHALKYPSKVHEVHEVLTLENPRMENYELNIK